MHTSLVLDFSSGSIAVGIIGRSKSLLPELLYSKRMKFYSEPSSFLALKSVMEGVLKDGIKVVREKGFSSSIDHALISLSSGIEDEKFIKKIEDEIHRAIGVKRGLAVEKFPKILSVVCGSLIDQPKFILNMEEELSEIWSVEDGEQKVFKIIPLGVRTLANNLHREKGVHPEVALSEVVLYLRDAMVETETPRVEKVINDFVSKFNKELSNFEVNGRVTFLVPEQFEDLVKLIEKKCAECQFEIFPAQEFVSNDAKRERNDSRLALLAAYSASLFD